MSKQRRKPTNMRGKQGRKDNTSKRINFDNERESKFVKDEIKFLKDKSNDPRWYARTPELSNAAANIGFYNNSGRPLPYITNYSSKTRVAVPGVMCVRYVPSLGSTTSYAVKQAMDSIYSYTVHANSRNQSYDATDEMLLILAGIDVFSMIALGIRAYGLMQIYDGQNSYLPDTLLRASQFNPSDLKDNYSHMLFDLNDLIAQSSQIWIPNTMPLIERRFWMNTNVYMDGDSVKSQYYLYVPSGYYQYNPTFDEQGGGLDFNRLSTMTWSQYVKIVQSMISALINESDRGLIFGDILKAYGSENIYRINQLDFSYRVEPTYDKEVLTQIENLVFCPTYPTGIKQTPNGNLHTIYGAKGASILTNSAGAPPAQVLLNFHQKENPTPDQIMVATRLMSCEATFTFGNIGSQSGVINFQPRTCGTEYATTATMYLFSWDPNSTTPTIVPTGVPQNNGNSTITNDIFFQWSAFDWAPHIYTAGYNINWDDVTKPQQYEPSYAMADYDNYIFIDYNTLDRIHTAALLSEFGVPITL